VISRADASKQRDAWLAAWRKDAPGTDLAAWLKLHAAPALTREDAAEALAARPSSPWSMETSESADDAAMGNVYVLLGRWDDALPLLERAVSTCAVLDDVPALVRAHLQLAQTYEAKGDVGRACGEYGWVVARWGGAKPRSVTAETAAKRARAAGCDKG